MKIYGDERTTDERASLMTMKRACPRFFANPSGSNEQFTVHRGCLIVRSTDIHACNAPVRRTAVYLFVPEGLDGDNKRPDLFCVSGCKTLHNVHQARRYVDNLLEHGNYEYDWHKKVNEGA